MGNDKILHGEEAKKYYLELVERGHLLYEVIVGSRAYGTALPTSDIDKKFIYIDTKERVYNGTSTLQLNIDKDYVGYEVGRYFELLSTANPNILEILFQEKDTILLEHPVFSSLVKKNRKKFFSKKIGISFAEYANHQIQKARGLNKKINNPIPKERKTLLDFCRAACKQGSMPLLDFLEQNDIPIDFCGCTSVPHMKNYYHLFIDPALQEVKNNAHLDAKNYVFGQMSFLEHFLYQRKRIESWSIKYQKEYDKLFKIFLDNHIKEYITKHHHSLTGILSEDEVQIKTSSILDDKLEPFASFYVNLEGFEKHCKDYRDYWNWIGLRNEERYQTNHQYNKGYDSKNMMHCYRLLDTCIDILEKGKLLVKRPNRDKLLKIRAGEYEYDDLILEADKMKQKINKLIQESNLPEEVNQSYLKQLLFNIKTSFYEKNIRKQ